MIKYTLIKTDGTVVPLDSNGEEMTLEQMYSFIECTMVERVQLSPEADMWCDEEGLLKSGFKRNALATDLVRKAWSHAPAEQIGIVGNVIVEDRSEEGAYTNENIV